MATGSPRMARIEKFDDPVTLPGMITSAQIFRSFTDSRFRVQALVSEGVRRPEGDLSPVPFPLTRALRRGSSGARESGGRKTEEAAAPIAGSSRPNHALRSTHHAPSVWGSPHCSGTRIFRQARSNPGSQISRSAGPVVLRRLHEARDVTEERPHRAGRLHEQGSK